MAFFTENELKQLGFKRVGKNVRVSDKASIFNHDQIEIGDCSRIDDFCVISGNIKIGKYVHITIMCNLAGGEKGIVIDDFSTVAYGCHIFTQSDDYSGQSMVNSNIPKKYKNEIKKSIHIERQVIVGAGCVIFPGANLREGTAVGANSLLLEETQPWSIYVGSPAIKIKDRSKQILDLEKQFLREESNQ